MKFEGDSIDDVVLLKVFSYLSYKTLAHCSHVSKKWHDLAKHVLGIRKGEITSFLFGGEIKTKDKYGGHTISLSSLTESINSQLKGLYAKPELTLCFVSDGIYRIDLNDQEQISCEDGPIKKRVKYSKNTLRKIKKLLPSNDIFYLSSRNVIATDASNSIVNEYDHECYPDLFDYGFGGFVFPKSDSYCIKTFVCTNRTSKSLPELNEKQDFYKLFGIENESELGILDADNSRVFENDILIKFLKEFYIEDMPICSAIAEDISVGHEQRSGIDEIEFTCFAFFGTDSFRVAQTSAVFVANGEGENLKDDQQAEINQKLTKLKSMFTNFNSKKSFALNIKCEGRNREGIERNFDCTEFRKIFPTTPICGLFNHGDIDYMYLAKTFQNIDSKMHWYFSTFFTVVSIDE